MSKSTWCQVEYENYLIDRLGYNPFTNKKYYKCKYGKDCFGSHGLEEMVLCKEAKSFNCPTINIGNRQNGRMKTNAVIDWLEEIRQLVYKKEGRI